MKIRTCLYCLTVFVSLISGFAFAAAGDLDSSFGTAGIVISNPTSTSNVLGTDAVIQSTGKIVAVGQYFDGAGNQLAPARFNSTGSLDTSFGTAAGWTIVNFGYPDIYALAAAEQIDGSIVVSGPANDGTRVHFFVARFTADGQVDSDYGNGGITLIDFGVNAVASDLATADNDKVVIAGFVQGSANENWGLARVDKKGKLDKSFGKHGLVVTDFFGHLDRAASVAINQTAKLLRPVRSRLPPRMVLWGLYDTPTKENWILPLEMEESSRQILVPRVRILEIQSSFNQTGKLS